MCKHGEIPRRLGVDIMVLITKGNTDTQGIGLMESLWQVVVVIIDIRLRGTVHLHSVLRGLRKGRGMGKDILEVNLAQKLSGMYQVPLFLVFLGLNKA